MTYLVFALPSLPLFLEGIHRLIIAFDLLNLSRKETLGDVQMGQFALAYPRGTPPVPGLLVAPRTFLSVHCRTAFLAICS